MGHESSPSFATAGSWKITCSAPATNTPADITSPGFELPAASQAVKTIITTFMRVEVKAGIANRP